MTKTEHPEPTFAVGTPVRFVNQRTKGGYVASISWSATYDEHLYYLNLGREFAFALGAELELLDDVSTQ